jgi:hypothetical protein
MLEQHGFDLHFLLFPLNCTSSDVTPCFTKRGEEKAEHMGLSDKQKSPESWENSAEEVSIVKVLGRILES